MAFETLIKPYRILSYTWTSPPTNEPIGMYMFGLANTFTLMDGPDDVSFRLNDPSNDELEWIEGVDGVPISEIYITSAETTGTVEIYVAWEVQWE